MAEQPAGTGRAGGTVRRTSGELRVPEEPVQVERIGRRSWWWVVLPAVTLLVGVAVGAGVMRYADRHGAGAGSSGSPTTSAQGPPAATPTAEPTGPVPRPCLNAARDAGNASDILQQAAQALAHLDAGKLANLVDRAEKVQNALTQDVNACRGGSG